MLHQRESWIWLPRELFPNQQNTEVTCMNRDGKQNHVVARFTKEYRFEKTIKRIFYRTSGDTFFRLSLNDRPICVGPASVGGDFLFNDQPRQNYYAFSEKLEGEMLNFFLHGEKTLTWDAVVRMSSVRMYEFSKGHGGFFLWAKIVFDDDCEAFVSTDETWTAQYLPAFERDGYFNGKLPPSETVSAQFVPNIWNTEDAPIPHCEEIYILPERDRVIVPAGKTIDAELLFDRIYAGYFSVRAETTGEVSVVLESFETKESLKKEEYLFCETTEYLGTGLHSAGGFRIHAENRGDNDAVLIFRLLSSNYPVDDQKSGHTTTSDDELDLVTDVCTHTLKICRQTLHLDSPCHCEPMACTGDYYVETMMTAFTFGDMRLGAFDVIRTAELLRAHDGRMFHTNYSLIWVQMLWDVYSFTGDASLLKDCEEALCLLLSRFSRYIGDNGLIENPPDYMFVDWLIPDGISTHHPPKALGQTCMNLFYFGALQTAERIYRTIGNNSMGMECFDRAKNLKKNIISQLWDADRGLFFEGLNTPTREELIYQFMPQNVEKRYYRMHANILAVYFGIFDRTGSQALVHRIMNDASLGEVQPYFLHFQLEAVYRAGLRDTYTLAILDRWKAPCMECSKGLTEGFYKPEPNYDFDHSHAWGGAPAYALPLALSGFEMLEPGFAKIRLDPSLLGLDYANVVLPTPKGKILIQMKKGESPRIFVPDGIECVRN